MSWLRCTERQQLVVLLLIIEILALIFGTGRVAASAGGTSGAGSALENSLALLPTSRTLVALEGHDRVLLDVSACIGITVWPMDQEQREILTTELRKILAERAPELSVRTLSDPLGADSSSTTVRILLAAGQGHAQSAADEAATRMGVGPIPWEKLGSENSEAYFLASGEVERRSTVLVAAGSDHGLFYGIQTLRQLLGTDGTAVSIPAVKVLDWPEFPIRGVIEGFDGLPWSSADRLAQLEFQGRYKLNTYVYAPKGDPYRSENWRSLYPAADLEHLSEVVRASRRNFVDFIYAISPGRSVTYSSDKDFDALVQKTEQLRSIGVTRFAIMFDDAVDQLKQPADRRKWGGDLAAAQAFLVNRYNAYLKKKEPNHRLVMIPTEHSVDAPTPYTESIAKKMDADVLVYWTGRDVIASRIGSHELEKAVFAYRHPLAAWDYYPGIGDTGDTLMLGPVAGHSPHLTRPGFMGFTFNAMRANEAGKLPLVTGADYAWNPGSYDPEASWGIALRWLINPEALDTYREFAKRFRSSLFTPWEGAPDDYDDIMAAVSAYRDDPEENRDALMTALKPYLEVASLRKTLNNPMLLRDVEPYIGGMSVTAQTLLSALELADIQHRIDDGLENETLVPARATVERTAAWESYYRLITDWQTPGEDLRDVGGTSLIIGQVMVAATRWFKVANLGAVKAVTTLAPLNGFRPEYMVDGYESTFFWTYPGVRTGDAIGVDLGLPARISRVRVEMGGTKLPIADPTAILHKGRMELSADGKTWVRVGSFSEQATVNVPFAPKLARYVRLVATAPQENWVQVREFSVEGDIPGPRAAAALNSAGGVVTEEGNPDLVALRDRDLTSAFTAIELAADDSFMVDFGDTREVAAVAAAFDPEARPVDAAAIMEASKDGKNWEMIGAVDSSYFYVSFNEPRPVRELRIRMTRPQSTPVRICEIYPVLAQ